MDFELSVKGLSRNSWLICKTGLCGN